MSYLEDLSDELGTVGIRGRTRTRILTEIADHLDCDPAAELGSPAALASQFADELGTSLARRAALAAFAALAFAGVLFAVAFLAHPGVLRSANDAAQPFGDLAGALMVIGAQVALVAGTLAALRTLRRRGARVIPGAEAAVIVRRAATGALAGLLSVGAFSLLAVILGGRAPGWWVVMTVTLSGAGAVALLATTPALLAAARLRPVAQGPQGDLFDDFGELVPRRLHGRPWTVALIVAAAVAVVITAAGAIQADGFDGALRGLVDGGACLVGFAVLGRYLGLRG